MVEGCGLVGLGRVGRAQLTGRTKHCDAYEGRYDGQSEAMDATSGAARADGVKREEMRRKKGVWISSTRCRPVQTAVGASVAACDNRRGKGMLHRKGNGQKWLAWEQLCDEGDRMSGSGSELILTCSVAELARPR